jgi:hypothetical protein
LVLELITFTIRHDFYQAGMIMAFQIWKAISNGSI